ncbi:MAG TPA: hypothetical protein VM427_01550 [Patescibacteria group bacterium]|nr:hypothetical protein [Patescibacteria group bacterium]
MKTQHTVAPRTATISRRSTLAASSLLLAFAVGACSPGASVAPASVALPSIDASAAASALSGAAMTALDQVDAAITTTRTDGTLTADEATSLTQLTAGVRTALTSGDTTAARAAVDNLGTKVDSFAAKLGAGAGPQLTAAIAALKAALPAS